MAARLSVEAMEHHHETTLNWTIRNLKKRFEASESTEECLVADRFTIGNENWLFSLEREGEEDMGIFLYFLGTDCLSAEYTVYLRSSSGEFSKDLEMELHKYAPQDANIEGASQNWGMMNWKSLSQLHNEGFLQNDELQMKLEVNVYSLNSKAAQLSADLKSSVVGPEITFVFMDEGSQEVLEKIVARSAPLSLQSPVFAKMMKEATEGEVHITDMTPKAMRLLLNSISSGIMGLGWQNVAEELLYGAHKYQLEQLKKFLSENIYSALTLENVWRIRKLTSVYKLPQLLKSTMKFLKENNEDFFENVEDITFKRKQKVPAHTAHSY